jgi:hypothetical protein
VRFNGGCPRSPASAPRRIAVGALNRQFIDAGADVAEYGSAMQAAIGHGYLEMHPSGGYVTLTQAGAELFA